MFIFFISSLLTRPSLVTSIASGVSTPSVYWVPSTLMTMVSGGVMRLSCCSSAKAAVPRAQVMPTAAIKLATIFTPVFIGTPLSLRLETCTEHVFVQCYLGVCTPPMRLAHKALQSSANQAPLVWALKRQLRSCAITNATIALLIAPPAKKP